MPSVFTRIIEGELPARFVWSDEVCVAFLSINPLRPGHTLVVPRLEVEDWLDLDRETASHVIMVAQWIGKAIHEVWHPTKVGLMIAGLEVPHTHLHVSPIDRARDLEFAHADPNPSPDDLDRSAEAIRRALAGLGFEQVSSG